MNLIKLKLSFIRYQGLNRIKACIHRPIARCLNGLVGTLNIQGERRQLRALRTANHGERFNLDPVLARAHFIADQSLDILVIDMFLTVGQILHAIKRFLKRILAQFIAQLAQLIAKRRTPRMFTHNQRRLRNTNGSRRHNLVGLLVFQHPVLVNTAFMRKRIPADNRLVILHGERRHRRHQFGRTCEHRRFNARRIRQFIAARFDRHHNFFQSRIARAFAKPVDRAFNLTRTAF